MCKKCCPGTTPRLQVRVSSGQNNSISHHKFIVLFVLISKTKHSQEKGITRTGASCGPGKGADECYSPLARTRRALCCCCSIPSFSRLEEAGRADKMTAEMGNAETQKGEAVTRHVGSSRSGRRRTNRLSSCGSRGRSSGSVSKKTTKQLVIPYRCSSSHRLHCSTHSYPILHFTLPYLVRIGQIKYHTGTPIRNLSLSK